MNRVVVIGNSGVGKSTFAARVAEVISGDHIEMDSIFWMPDWQERPDEECSRILNDLLQPERWVLDGNYSRFRDQIWGKADTVIWLNYPFLFNFFRLFKRTIRRVWTREDVFEGCPETFRSQFFSKDSLLWWFLTTYKRRKQVFEGVFNDNQYPHLKVFELNHPKEAGFLNLTSRGF